MIFRGSTYLFYFSAITVLRFEISCIAGQIKVNGRTNRIYTKEAAKLLQNMDQSVDPCTHFYNFTCGGFMKQTVDDDRYHKLTDKIQEILEGDRDIPGSDVSIARNIYTNCKKIVPDKLSERELINSIATKIGLISNINRTYGQIEYNKNFDWIDGVHKLRDMGLNFRFLIGLYVSPRSQTDKRNILEVRRPILFMDNDPFRLLQIENLTIVNAGEFIKSLNGSFPLQKIIEGFLHKDTKFSLEDEIRIDETYIKTLINYLRNTSITDLAEKLYTKIDDEISRLLPSGKNDDENREILCLENVMFYDYYFQVVVSKSFFTEKKKNFVTKMIDNIMKVMKSLINNSASFDEESKIKSIKKLSAMQLMIAYGNNTIEPPALDWSNVDYQKYVYNILTLSKHQMDSKFRQLNLVNDVREWEMVMSPFTYNAAYNHISNSLYLPAIFLTLEMYELDLPSYIHYGSIGFTIGHELSHVIDKSLSVSEVEADNFAEARATETKACLRRAFYELTGKYKIREREDLADLTGYKIAYYSFLESAKQNGHEDSLPGLKYNSRQMFWITSANLWCRKYAFEIVDNVHSPAYSRVLMPLSNLPEFVRDFNCPAGSPMNSSTKCAFL